jgi:hypothetical protein
VKNPKYNVICSMWMKKIIEVLNGTKREIITGNN